MASAGYYRRRYAPARPPHDPYREARDLRAEVQRLQTQVVGMRNDIEHLLAGDCPLHCDDCARIRAAQQQP